jgi:tetratricopeptide (TPR) repeat protein
LEAEDTEDLNDLLTWVALATRPLYLGELDAALRLKSEDGEGVTDLEEKLRKVYSGFFTLTREDGLSTSDLVEQKRFGDFEEGEYPGMTRDGQDNFDAPLDFQSDPRTTTVSFSHASISEFFADPSRGKIAGQDSQGLSIGFEQVQAQALIANTCLQIIGDANFRDRMTIRGGAISLLDYVRSSWYNHLQAVDHDSIDPAIRLSIRSKLANMFHKEDIISNWACYWDFSLFTAERATTILVWLGSLAPNNNSSPDGDENICSSLVEDPLDLFSPAMQWLVRLWVGPALANVKPSMYGLPIIIHSWLERKAGKSVEKLPCLGADDIIAAASFAAPEKTPEYHRNIARSLREHKLYKEAKKIYEMTLSQDKTDVLAMGGLARTHFELKEYAETIRVSELQLETIRENNLESQDGSTEWISCEDIACSYVELEKLENRPSDNSLELEKKACENFTKAISYNKLSAYSLRANVKLWHNWAMAGLYPVAESKYISTDDLPHPDTCFQEIIKMTREMDEACSKLYDADAAHWLWLVGSDQFSFEHSVAFAAHETNELPWLEQCYLNALVKARKALRTSLAAKVTYGLANLYHKFIKDDEKAVNLWESLVLQSSFSVSDWSVISRMGRYAVTSLAGFYSRQALEDDSSAGPWLSKIKALNDRSDR